jgi:hypothetical protein
LTREEKHAVTHVVEHRVVLLVLKFDCGSHLAVKGKDNGKPYHSCWHYQGLANLHKGKGIHLLGVSVEVSLRDEDLEEPTNPYKGQRSFNWHAVEKLECDHYVQKVS